MDKTRNPGDLIHQSKNIIYTRGYAPEIVVRDFGAEGINIEIAESWQVSLNINLDIPSVQFLIEKLLKYINNLPEPVRWEAMTELQNRLGAISGFCPHCKERLVETADGLTCAICYHVYSEPAALDEEIKKPWRWRRVLCSACEDKLPDNYEHPRGLCPSCAAYQVGDVQERRDFELDESEAE